MGWAWKQSQHRYTDDDLGLTGAQGFNVIMQRWGLAGRSDTNGYRWGVRAALVLSVGLGVSGLVSVGYDLHHPNIYMLSAVCLIVVGSYSATVQMWKLYILRHKRYIAYRQWVLGKRLQGDEL